MIEVKGTSRTFAMGNTQVHALRGVDLRIEDGDFVAIMGPSGSGKSTLMYLLGALDRPSEGSILHGEQDIANCDSNGLAELRGRRIGFVFQMFSLMPTLSAFDNVELPMIFQRVPRAERAARAKGLLELVGMEDRMNHLPGELSGGEQQRVAIARALSNEPELLLADEPTGNLDSKTGEQIIDLLQSLNRSRGTTIVLVTHDAALAGHADRTIQLLDGCVSAEGRAVGETPLGVSPGPDPEAGAGGKSADALSPDVMARGGHGAEAPQSGASAVDELAGLGDGISIPPGEEAGASSPRNPSEGGGSHAS